MISSGSTGNNMGITGMFGLVNAGINIATGFKGLSSFANSDTSSSGANEFGAYLAGGDPASEAYDSANKFIQDNPFLSTIFQDTKQVKEDAAKLQDFEGLKGQEFAQAKEMADAKINSAQEEYYDKELQKKLEEFDNKNTSTDTDYQKKRDNVVTEHNKSVRQKELELLEKKQAKEDEIRESSIKRRDEFFDKFQELAKEGFTDEANKKRADLVKEFQLSEEKFLVKDQQSLLEVQKFGFPDDSNVSSTVKQQAEGFAKTYADYKLPDGDSVPKDVKGAYNRMEEYQKKMADNLSKWTSGDVGGFMDSAMGQLRDMFSSIQGQGQSEVAQADKLHDMFMEQQMFEKDQPKIAMDLSQFKFDNNSFGF